VIARIGQAIRHALMSDWEIEQATQRLISLTARKAGHDLPLDPSPQIHVLEGDEWVTYEREK
jgi:hypothetical protein